MSRIKSKAALAQTFNEIKGSSSSTGSVLRSDNFQNAHMISVNILAENLNFLIRKMRLPGITDCWGGGEGEGNIMDGQRLGYFIAAHPPTPSLPTPPLHLLSEIIIMMII